MLKIIAGSRIHLGLYNIKNKNQYYGSIGLYIKNPQTIIGSKGKTIKESLQLKKKICGDQKASPAKIIKAPPSHIGLGSTTQIKLSIAKYYSIICKIKNTIEKLAIITGRGEVSGIGIHGFRLGGFIIDTGKKELGEKKPPKLLLRIKFPEEWSVIIGIPYKEKGYSEKKEKRIMKEISKGRKNNVNLRSILYTKIIPGLLGKNLKLFGDGVEEIQRTMGKIFSSYQKGLYATTETYKLIMALKTIGAMGTGQSSWGPLAYGFMKQSEAFNSLKKLQKIIYKENIKTDFIITKARNTGYKVIRSL